MKVLNLLLVSEDKTTRHNLVGLLHNMEIEPTVVENVAVAHNKMCANEFDMIIIVDDRRQNGAYVEVMSILGAVEAAKNIDTFRFYKPKRIVVLTDSDKAQSAMLGAQVISPNNIGALNQIVHDMRGEEYPE